MFGFVLIEIIFVYLFVRFLLFIASFLLQTSWTAVFSFITFAMEYPLTTFALDSILDIKGIDYLRAMAYLANRSLRFAKLSNIIAYRDRYRE